MTPWEKRNELWAPTILKNFVSRGFEAAFAPSKEEALAKALSWIPAGSTVSWGGSFTLDEIGLKDAVRKTNPVLDRDTGKSPEEREEIMRKALLSDVFLMGSNAVSADGQLVNVDGNGNRVAPLIYGPKSVIVVAGMNKVVRSVEAGMERIRTVAAPVNQMRFLKEDSQTGCSKTGVCVNCNAPDCICNQIVVTRRCRPAGRIKLLLVGENLGI